VAGLSPPNGFQINQSAKAGNPKADQLLSHVGQKLFRTVVGLDPGSTAARGLRVKPAMTILPCHPGLDPGSMAARGLRVKPAMTT
jgi:hypothetical protein